MLSGLAYVLLYFICVIISRILRLGFYQEEHAYGDRYLSPNMFQAFTWTNADIFTIPLVQVQCTRRNKRQWSGDVNTTGFVQQKRISSIVTDSVDPWWHHANFPNYWPPVRVIQRSPFKKKSPVNGQWCVLYCQRGQALEQAVELLLIWDAMIYKRHCSSLRGTKSNNTTHYINISCLALTHCGLVTSYGDIDLGQHWLR